MARHTIPSLRDLAPESFDRIMRLREAKPELFDTGSQRPARRRYACASRPEWLGRSKIPLTIVCGPPGAGKSTFVSQHSAPGDMIICFDMIATRLFGRKSSERAQASLNDAQRLDVMRERNEMLAQLTDRKNQSRWRHAWLIVSEPRPENRTWWAERVGARVIVLVTPPGECRARTAADADRGDRRGAAALDYIDTWHQLYAPAECDSGPEIGPRSMQYHSGPRA